MSAGLTLSSLSHLPDVAQAIPTLGQTLADHPDFDVRWRVAGALGRIRDARCADYLAAALTDPSFYARDEAAWSLGRLGPIAVPAVRRTLNALSLDFQPFAALALGLTGDAEAGREAIAILRRCIVQGQLPVRRDAIYFLGEIASTPEAGSLVAMVQDHLGDAEDDLTQAAAWCWGMLSPYHPKSIRASTSQIVDLARQHPLETVRHEAVVAIGKSAGVLHDPAIAHHVWQALNKDGAGRVRYAAMQSLRLLATQGMPIESPLSHDCDSDFGVRFEQHLLQQQIGNR
jgi:HEAT repeat protein